MERPRAIPEEVFKDIIESVTGDPDTQTFTKIEATAVIVRCADVMGIVEVPKVEVKEDKVDKVLKEFGF